MIELGVLTRAGWLLVAQVVDGRLVDSAPLSATADKLSDNLAAAPAQPAPYK